MRRIPAWRKRVPPPAPWSPEEDAKLVDMIRCGLSVDYYKDHFPDRRFGHVLERRLELVEAGQAQHQRRL